MTTPDQNEAREARDFPCCEDGEHVPAEIAGDLFTATLNRAQWHRVDEALAAHGRNDAVWSQIAATKTAVRPTPPEDVAALQARIRQLEAERAKCDGGCDYNSGPEETCSLHGRPVAEVWEALDIRTKRVQELEDQVADLTAAALAAVPADGETETTIVVQVLCRDGVWRDTNWPSLAEARAEMPGAQANFRAVRVMVTPIPESEEQR